MPLGGNRPAGIDIEVPPPVDVPAQAGLAGNLCVIPAESREHRRMLGAMLAREHPEGAVRHVGPQLRYLIGSDHGWLGGFVFASSALSLAARRPLDRMGRGDARGETSPRGRAFAVPGPAGDCLSQPGVANPGPVPAAVAGGFLAGLRPFAGAGRDLRLARLVRDQPAGRELDLCRRDRGPGTALGRRWLGAAEIDLHDAPCTGLAPESRRVGEGWAGREFGAAPLGDRRLTRRLVRCVELQAKSPSKTFFSAATGDQAAVTGYYGLFERPDDSKATPEAILATHRARTEQRMRRQETVLCIQDGTDLNFATHPLCEGLDRIGRNKNSEGTLGLHLHSTLVVSGDGIPLGVPRIEFSSPEDEGPKSGRWLRGWRDAGTLKAGRARVISVMDREGDIFELFAARRDGDGPDLLVRAQHNRGLGRGAGKLFQMLRDSPERARIDIPVERLSARNSARGQSASPGRAGRVASAALRWMEVDLPVPEKRRGEFGTRPCRMQVVHAFEDCPPEGTSPLEWTLLTTLPVATTAQAQEVLRWYRLRWRIEDWRRILKSGCRPRRLRSAPPRGSRGWRRSTP